jgi:hypothetical protein
MGISPLPFIDRGRGVERSAGGSAGTSGPAVRERFGIRGTASPRVERVRGEVASEGVGAQVRAGGSWDSLLPMVMRMSPKSFVCLWR